MYTKFSFIVPVYNSEKYIERCIKSLLSQNYNNFEIILVDDGSCDNSINICENYEKNDNRITLIKKEHTGVSDTRNLGISNSTGDYILFIDSDDTLESNCLNKLADKIQGILPDLITYGISYEIYKNNELVRSNTVVLSHEVVTYNFSSCFKLIYNSIEFSSVCNKCYNRNFINKNNIKFDTGLICNEDTYFNIQSFSKCQRFVNIGEVFYRYFCIEGTNYYYKRNGVNDFDSLERLLNNIFLIKEEFSIIELDKLAFTVFYTNLKLYFSHRRTFKEKTINIHKITNLNCYNKIIQISAKNSLKLRIFSKLINIKFYHLALLIIERI